MESYHLANKIIKELLLEADVNRRDFLKTSGAAIASSLLGAGIPAPIVKSALAGAPKIMNITIASWDMSRGEWTNLAEISDEVAKLFSFFKRSGIPVKHAATDYENYAYEIELTPENLKRIGKHVMWDSEEDGIIDFENGLQFEWIAYDGDGDDRFDSTDNNVNHPIIDFWNNYAKFDGSNAAQNSGFVNKIRREYGDKLELPRVQSPSGDVEELDWDQFGEYCSGPDEYFDEFDDDDSMFLDQFIEQFEEEPYDEYDEHLRSQWSTEGGFTESIQKLYQRIRNQSITLTEALQWVNDLKWPKAEQEKLAVYYIQKTIKY